MQLKLSRIKLRRTRVPQQRITDVQLGLSTSVLHWNSDSELLARRTGGMNRNGGSAFAQNAEVHRCPADIRRDLKSFDELRCARLNEDTLPDAAGAAVPAPLFTHRLLIIGHSIFDADYEFSNKLAFAIASERISDIELKRGKSTLVCAERLAVAPCFRGKIGCANCKDHPSAVPFLVQGDPDVTAIPADFKSRRAAIVLRRYLEWISIYPSGVEMIISRSIRFTPGSQRFPAKRLDDLVGP